MTDVARPARRLIVNADDFGRSSGINRGIFAAHTEGIVTSASLMVRWPAASDAARFARTSPGLSLGLHLDLAEWDYDGEAWRVGYEVVPCSDPSAVTQETWRQVERFDQLYGDYPSHIDSHQHVHRTEPARQAVLAVGAELGVPVRQEHPGINYCGAFHGQSGTGEPCPSGITTDALIGLIADLPPGITELTCHPGLGDESRSVYGTERDRELDTLRHPSVRAALAECDVALVSFRDLDPLG